MHISNEWQPFRTVGLAQKVIVIKALPRVRTYGSVRDAIGRERAHAAACAEDRFLAMRRRLEAVNL